VSTEQNRQARVTEPRPMRHDRGGYPRSKHSPMLGTSFLTHRERRASLTTALTPEAKPPEGALARSQDGLRRSDGGGTGAAARFDAVPDSSKHALGVNVFFANTRPGGPRRSAMGLDMTPLYSLSRALLRRNSPAHRRSGLSRAGPPVATHACTLMRRRSLLAVGKGLSLAGGTSVHAKRQLLPRSPDSARRWGGPHIAPFARELPRRRQPQWHASKRSIGNFPPSTLEKFRPIYSADAGT